MSRPDAPRRLDLTVGGDEFDSSLLVRRSSFDHSTWLPAALLATLVLLASALQAFGAESQPLKWRAARSLSKQAQSTTRPPTASRSVVRRLVTEETDSRGYAVVRVVYDEPNSPNLQAVGEAQLESVLIHPRDPQFEGTGPAYRTAQDPFEDDELSREIGLPFGESDPVEELPDPVQPSLPNAVENEFEFDEPALDSGIQDEPEAMQDQGDQFTQPKSQSSLEPTTPSPIDIRRNPPESATPTSLSPEAQNKFDEEREKANQSCRTANEITRQDRITNISLDIRVPGRAGREYPFECMLDDGLVYSGRNWAPVTYQWKAAANCHKPLYFEQHHLERYGHSWGPCVQPIVSGAHFFTRLPVLPYCMGLTPPNECIYPLGYYRPGNCAPYMVDPIPFTWRAALFQAGATVGVGAILP